MTTATDPPMTGATDSPAVDLEALMRIADRLENHTTRRKDGRATPSGKLVNTEAPDTIRRFVAQARALPRDGEGQAIVRELLECWPETSVPNGPLCVRAANYVNGIALPPAGEVGSTPMVLHCPKCGLQHIDAATEAWPNPPHRSHLCAGCGHIWRPADVPTEGVAAVQTKGREDSPIARPSPREVELRAALAAEGPLPTAPDLLVAEWSNQFGRHRGYSLKDRFGANHCVTITRHSHIGWPDVEAAATVRASVAMANARQG